MKSLTKELLEQFGQKTQKMLQDIMDEAMKEIGKTAMTTIETTAMAAQSTQTTWANIATASTHHQAPGNDTSEPHIVILARCNREALMHPDPDTLTSNNTPNTTIETINKTLTSNKAMAIQRLKSNDIVITFKKEATEYKKRNNWITEVFKTRATHTYHKIVMLAKGLPNRDITRAHIDLERLFENLKRRNTPDITRIRLRYIQQDTIYRTLIISCNSA